MAAGTALPVAAVNLFLREWIYHGECDFLFVTTVLERVELLATVSLMLLARIHYAVTLFVAAAAMLLRYLSTVSII